MEFDEEYAPTEEEIAEEEAEEPLMMQNAASWDNFIEYVRLCQAPWAAPDDDTDDYRKARAVEFFNAGSCAPSPRPPASAEWHPASAGNKVANDLLRLKPTIQSWVPHVMCFIVPRQILKLGCPSRRSADSCESFGAWLKKNIKHRTCRRHMTTAGKAPSEHQRRTSRGITKWTQHFRKGYMQQVFTRACVAEKLNYGAENEPFLQRADWKRLRSGKSTKKYETKHAKAMAEQQSSSDSPLRPRCIADILAEQM